MEEHETDAAGAPIIEGLSAKIGVLERRKEFLDEQIEDRAVSRGAEGFAKSERKALKAGILALKYHRADIEGLDQPILVLQELVDAYKKGGPDGEGFRDFRVALERARKLLAEWGD